MKKVFAAGLIVVASSLLLTSLSEAGSRGHHHSHSHHRPGVRVFVGVGPAVWWGPYPYWYYPPPAVVYAPPPPPPIIIQEQPPMYIQQAPPPAAAATPAPPSAAENFWYFCASAKAYYPSVPSCPEAWVKVAPRPQ